MAPQAPLPLSDEAQHVLARVHEAKIAYLDLQFTDVTGISKTVQIPARQLEIAFTEGIWFDGSAIEGFARVAESAVRSVLRSSPAVAPRSQSSGA